MKKFLSVLFVALMHCGYAHADNPNCNQYGCTEVPERVLFTAGGNLSIYFSSPAPTELGCTLGGNNTATVYNTNPGRDLIASVLLTAKHTNTPVFIRINTGSNPCSVQYVEPRP